MASQPARSLRRSKAAPARATKLSDAMKTKQASIEAENRVKTPSKKRLRRDSIPVPPPDSNKKRKVEAPAHDVAAPNTPASVPLETSTSRRSRSASANPKPAVREEKTQTVAQSKVANGIKHELARLQPAAADTTISKDEKRKLRSEGTARFKSELSLYFPEYDVVMKNEEEESKLLDGDTPILIVDNGPSMPKPRGRQSISPSKRKTAKPVINGVSQEAAFRQFSPSLFSNLYQAQKVDLSCLDKVGKTPKSDPLPDEYYIRPHLREERAEKGIKNLENMNSLHGRNHIAQLLEGLQGPDWLKVLGVGGVTTEAKKAEFEYAQTYFIKRCVAYLKKCREWKEIEKRRELEKKRKAQEADEESGDDSDGDPPDYSDVDHAAAMQLHHEAVKRSAPHQPRRRGQKVGFVEPVHQVKPQKELTSFFAKAHLREAALSKRRRSGRGVMAFGQPMPDMPEAEFDLPEDIKEELAKNRSPKRNARTRRSSNTGSIVSRMTVPK